MAGDYEDMAVLGSKIKWTIAAVVVLVAAVSLFFGVRACQRATDSADAYGVGVGESP